MVNPLTIPQKLHSNPQQNLHFATAVKKSSGEVLQVADPKATRALISLMDMYAVLGGAASHYGGPAALAELMSALYALMFEKAKAAKSEWHELFNFVNDAGHCENGLYALKANYGLAGLRLEDLKKFRSIESRLTGHGESHLFPEGVLLSNGPLGSAFPQSQGLALADGMTQKKRTTVTVLSDGAAMEGEAREALAAIPGLAQKGLLAPFVLIISDNNTKLSGRIDAESFSMQPTFDSLATLGWNVLSLPEGNNLQACLSVLEKALDLAESQPQKPVAVHAKTVKGIGTQKTAQSASGGHGFPLKSPTELKAFLSEIYGSANYPEVFDHSIAELIEIENKIKASGVKDSGEKIQKGIASAMIKARQKGLPVLSVTSDLPGSTGVAEFRKEFPKASVDVGVAESNMISTAAGLSKAGFIPVVDTFAQFGVTKGALPLTMASLSQAPVICIFSHTGFQDAADGASHQALTYLSMLAAIPHVEVITLTCSEEADALLSQAFDRFTESQKSGAHQKSYVFFLGRENFIKSYGQKNYALGQSQVVFDSSAEFENSYLISAPGSLLPQALAAAQKLRDQKRGAIVINPGFLNHVDADFYKTFLAKCKGRLITVEDHQLIGGWGAILSHALLLKGFTFQVRSLAVHGEFGQSAYNAIELYKKHSLDAEAIVRTAMEF